MFKIMSEKALTMNSKQNGLGRFGSGRLTNDQTFYRGQALAKETFLKIKSNIGKEIFLRNVV